MTISNYLNDVTKLVSSLEHPPFENIFSELKRVIQERHTIYVVGNGTSGITVSHFANDLMKNSGENITKMLGLGIKVIPLSDNMPFFTAVSNDFSLDSAYVNYLKACAVPGDLVIIFSHGVPHRNLIEAAKFSFNRGVRVVSVTGALSEGLKSYSHILYDVRGKNAEEIDAVHTFLCHSWAVQLKKELKMPVVFLDRDGVINRNRQDYIKSWEEFKFLPGVEEAIRKLNENGFAVVVITNQSVVGRKIISPKTLNEIHDRMYRTLYNKGAIVSRIYHCPHTPHENCECRKPKDGMVQQALEELPLDREKGIMIGDNYTDIEAGRSSGLTTILLAKNQTHFNGLETVPDYLADDLPKAVDLILSKSFRFNTVRLERKLEASAV